MKLDQELLESRTLEIARRFKQSEGTPKFYLPDSLRSTQVRGLIQALCEQFNGEESDD